VVCLTDGNALLAIGGKRPPHRLVSFSSSRERLQKQINMSSMAQAKDHITAKMLNQLPLKVPKAGTDLFLV
jgi:hypothetical protein